MQTITIQAYTFDELSDEAKEKAREWAREVLWGDMSLEYLMNDRLYDILQERGVKFEEGEESGLGCYYSLSYAQGDGVMFVGDIEWKGYYVEIKHKGFYTHYSSKEFTIVDKEGNEIYDNEIREEFNDLYIDVCKELLEYGYSEIEYMMSDESVDDFIRSNEYLFTSGGSRTMCLY